MQVLETRCSWAVTDSEGNSVGAGGNASGVYDVGLGKCVSAQSVRGETGGTRREPGSADGRAAPFPVLVNGGVCLHAFPFKRLQVRFLRC